MRINYSVQRELPDLGVTYEILFGLLRIYAEFRIGSEIRRNVVESASGMERDRWKLEEERA